MGILDKILGKPKIEEPEQPEPASDHICSLCNQPGADKKWAGTYWHKSCLRKARKMAKGMV